VSSRKPSSVPGSARGRRQGLGSHRPDQLGLPLVQALATVPPGFLPQVPPQPPAADHVHPADPQPFPRHRRTVDHQDRAHGDRLPERRPDQPAGLLCLAAGPREEILLGKGPVKEPAARGPDRQPPGPDQ
jgi:hypothetical protein